jgi:hypothetical protein
MEEIKYTILNCVFVRTFVTPFYYGSGTGSGSDFFTSYGSGSTRQKVTVPTVPFPVPVPQHGVYLPLVSNKLRRWSTGIYNIRRAYLKVNIQKETK